MKKRILPIILTVVALTIIVLMVFLINKQNVSKTSGKIKISLYKDELTLLEEKEISFTEDDTFFKLLEENYDIEMRGSLLIKINDLYAPNTAYEFIKIYVNDSPSKYGVKQMKLIDNQTVKFIIEKTYEQGFNDE